MGKSTVAGFFQDCGVPVYDADQTVHDLYKGELVSSIGYAFPDAVAGGQVDRKVLSKIVTDDPEAFSKLEAIVHPALQIKQENFIRQSSTRGEKIAILDIPLLFETKKDQFVDIIIVVSTTEKIQEERVMKRPGMTREKFEAIKNRQMPDEEKRKRAHFIVDTSESLEQTKSIVLELHKELLKLQTTETAKSN